MKTLRAAGKAILAGAATIVGLSGCTQPREVPEVFGQHPAGWTTSTSPDFHGSWLRSHADDLASCAACHGADYQGGAVEASCTTKGCHTSKGGPEFCGTCHGDAQGPLPSTGAHAIHSPFCADCHDVPKTVQSPGHIDGLVEVRFSGLALTGGATPTWNAADRTCSGVYCHIKQTPTWQKPPDEVPCAACHEAPPATHERWSRIATPAPQACATCHPLPPMSSHLDARLQLTPNLACDTCHGHGPRGAPAPALDGSVGAASRGVGAHARHLDETLADRIGRVVACSACHPVPASVTAPGHLDTSAPADVVLPQSGAYDAVAQSCVVGCHWNKSPGPVWTDDSGAARACDACHGFPPVLLRNGTPHTVVAPTVSECIVCHLFTPATHVDGTVNLAP